MNFPALNVEGKVALVTGGTKGIGIGMAKTLGHFGAKVAVCGRCPEDGQRAVSELKTMGVEALYIAADVTDKAQVAAMVAQVVEQYGRLDILVNNAGMNIRKSLIEIEEEDWDQVITTNLKGIFLVGQAAAHQMIRQQSGRIINISSILGTIALPNQTSYAASKGGINQLTKIWALELAPYHITVNAIGPSYINTPMTAPLLSQPDKRREFEDATLVKRIGELEDLAGPLIFFASEASAFVTGQILYVDGG
jgi:NAD(P)-dependent dehydrogenase (short-subunit alcohol dehydrogenase family)